MTIESKNLRHIPCDKAILQSAIEGSKCLAEKLNLDVEDNWTEIGVGALQYSLNKLSESEKERCWWK